MSVRGLNEHVSRRLTQVCMLANMLPEEIRLWQTLWRTRDLLIPHPFGLSSGRPAGLKHLGRYLATSLSPSQRLTILSHTYQFWSVLRDKAIVLNISKRCKIWSRLADETELSIWLGPSERAPMEGEIELVFKRDHQTLFTASFSIAPGRLVGAVSDAILIGGMQGEKQSQDAVRDSCKRLNEISPQDVLIVAVRALAALLNIDYIAGIPLSKHVSRANPDTEWCFNYDFFWERQKAILTFEGFYLFTRQAQDRAYRSNQSRAKRKRRLKLELQEEIYSRLRLLGRANQYPSNGTSLARIFAAKAKPNQRSPVNNYFNA